MDLAARVRSLEATLAAIGETAKTAADPEGGLRKVRQLADWALGRKLAPHPGSVSADTGNTGGDILDELAAQHGEDVGLALVAGRATDVVAGGFRLELHVDRPCALTLRLMPEGDVDDGDPGGEAAETDCVPGAPG